MGLLDIYGDPQANMALAAGLLSGGNFGQALGKGLGAAQAVQIAEQEKKLREAQAKEIAMRAERARQEQEQQMAAGQRDAQFQQALQQGVPPAQLAQYFPEKVDLLKKLADAPNFGRQAVARTIEVEGPGGTKMVRQLDQYGNPVTEDLSGYVAPQGVNLGNKYVFTKPTAGQSFDMGMSPSERDASARGWKAQSLAEQRLAMEQGNSVSDAGGPTQAAYVKMFGKPAPGFRWKADGSQEFIPGGPADQKAQQQNVGQDTVASVVKDLRDKYVKLNEEGGIVSTENNAFSNAAARFGSSGLGQIVGGTVGTKAQSARDSIEMTRPLLLASIMRATGMSAKQMDSNAELKLWLATATDPTKGLEANNAALDRILTTYGGGAKAVVAKDEPQPKKTLSSLPTPNASNKGQRIRDTVTGKVLVSNGMQWKEE